MQDLRPKTTHLRALPPNRQIKHPLRLLHSRAPRHRPILLRIILINPTRNLIQDLLQPRLRLALLQSHRKDLGERRREGGGEVLLEVDVVELDAALADGGPQPEDLRVLRVRDEVFVVLEGFPDCVGEGESE